MWLYSHKERPSVFSRFHVNCNVSFCVLQDNFLKLMNAITDWVITVGHDATNAVSRMEGAWKPTPYSFKVPEQVRVPEDFHTITRAMLNPKQIPTYHHFQLITAEVINQRYWTWHLTHPQIGDDRFHLSRSMCRSAELRPTVHRSIAMKFKPSFTFPREHVHHVLYNLILHFMFCLTQGTWLGSMH